MTEYGRFTPSHLAFPELGKCTSPYYTIKSSEFLWTSPPPGSQVCCSFTMQSCLSVQNCCDFWRKQDSAGQPLTFLVPAAQAVLLSGKALQPRQTEVGYICKISAGSKDLQQILLAEPARICVAVLPGSWAAFRRATADIRAPTWFYSCLHHPWHSLVLAVNSLWAYSAHSVPLADERWWGKVETGDKVGFRAV